MRSARLHDHKSVVLADLRPGQETHVDIIRLSGGRGLFRFDGTLDELRAQAPNVRNQLCLINVQTETHQPMLSEQVRDLLPQAVLLQVLENAKDRKLEILTEEVVSADVEPDIQDMFRDYLTDQGSSLVPADRLMSTFTHIFAALDEDRSPQFDEETLLTEEATTGPREVSR